ncbi:hypothetical protein [Janibacter sp. GXQ6167]|uniref:hypothetical protein n=1 Tax=Janibacter sp. GXQ6167 TaxID=3240791 RepID=UPI00352531AA
MTTIRVDGDGIAALGGTLREVADHLTRSRDRSAAASGGDYGFISRATDAALDGVVGDFEQRRIALVTGLESLATAARQAGACYLQAESSVHNGFVGGRRVG